MALVKSIINLTGRIGETVFRRVNGKTIAGLKGGPSKEQIQRGEEFAITRLNMREFGACIEQAKDFYDLNGQIIFECVRKKTSMRYMVASLKKTQTTDLTNTLPQGERTVQFNNTQVGFNLNLRNTLNSVFNGEMTIEKSIGRDSITVGLGIINPGIQLNIPAGATHFKIFLSLTALSQRMYNSTINAYEEPTQKLQTQISTDQLPVNVVTTDISLIALFPGSPIIAASTDVIAMLGVSFYKKVGNISSKMFENDALQIIDVDNI